MNKILTIPAELASELANNLLAFEERHPEYFAWLQEKFADPAFKQQFETCWISSQYVYEQCLRKPQLFIELEEQQLLTTSYTANEINDSLQQRIAVLTDDSDLEQNFDALLRNFRNQQMIRIIWRDVNRLADTMETTRDLSLLADACIQAAQTFHHQQLAQKHGEPLSREGKPQQLIVIGMGKLGAYELNLSSDIDLIFTYPEPGQTTDDKRCLDNHEFFTRLGQKIIQSLDAITADGFVFRVDMRLRPYGQSGSLVFSFDAIQQYYEQQGRDWERYAMIKARLISGDAADRELLTTLLRPFSFRKYIDYSAIDSLREMKRMIQREVKRKGLHDNVKLGAGGIREVEFIGQSFQLIRGGKELELQQRQILKVLKILEEKNCINHQMRVELSEAYVFLRNVEHGIQAWRDEQTQQLPCQPLAQQALAYLMGFENYEAFLEKLSFYRANVDRHFGELIDDFDTDKQEQENDEWRTIWDGSDEEDEFALNFLYQQGFKATATLKRLTEFRHSPPVLRMQSVGRERLDRFMPIYLEALAAAKQPTVAFEQSMPIIEAVLRRTAYLLLLMENQHALTELVTLSESSPLIASYLAKYPSLMDELVDASSLYQTPSKEVLQAELQSQLMRIPMEDLEQQMYGLRYFRLAHLLKIAACEVSGRLPLMKVSDYLTWLAEVILDYVLNLAWSDLSRKHGEPEMPADSSYNKAFVVVGYGKLGGIELGHGSDLDLVFIYDAKSQGVTNGGRPIDNHTFYTRLGQRMIHIITTFTDLGELYEVDMRLRPSGDSGLLVISLAAFEKYQRNEAWTWEHQALVRSRVVAGDLSLAKKFEKVRTEQLAESRHIEGLQQEVINMRHKMRDHLLNNDEKSLDNPIFPLKQGIGGVVDIEFMVQFCVLAWSHKHPELSVYTDNIRILEAMSEVGLIPDDEAQQLIQAYIAFRGLTHRLNMKREPEKVPAEMVAEEREIVLRKWADFLGEA